jgi:DNA-binding response OmpR family regulator
MSVLFQMTQPLKHSVFIVDDDQDDRESIRDAFLENNHRQDYIFMKNGDQLIFHFNDAIPRKNPSLILLDLNMPGKDGRDVLREIKNSDELKLIPVIVITTSSSDKDREISYKLGANCFLTKPNSYDELVKITDCIARLWLS